MKKLQRLLATVGLCVLMLLPVSALSGGQILDDKRFITSEATIGKNPSEVKKEIGEPGGKGACSMSTLVNGQSVTKQGEGWSYRYIYDSGVSFLSICFIQGLVVAELRTDNKVGEDGRQYSIVREILDHRLLRNIIDGQPNRPDWADPEGPNI